MGRNNIFYFLNTNPQYSKPSVTILLGAFDTLYDTLHDKGYGGKTSRGDATKRWSVYTYIDIFQYRSQYRLYQHRLAPQNLVQIDCIASMTKEHEARE